MEGASLGNRHCVLFLLTAGIRYEDRVLRQIHKVPDHRLPGRWLYDISLKERTASYKFLINLRFKCKRLSAAYNSNSGGGSGGGGGSDDDDDDNNNNNNNATAATYYYYYYYY